MGDDVRGSEDPVRRVSTGVILDSDAAFGLAISRPIENLLGSSATSMKRYD